MQRAFSHNSLPRLMGLQPAVSVEDLSTSVVSCRVDERDESKATDFATLKRVTGSTENLNKAQKISEILFFSSVGNLTRLKNLLKDHPDLNLSDPALCDYDSRTPLHVAADCGSYAVAEFLISQGAPVDAIDRFNLTPLACASRSQHKELTKLIHSHKGQVVGSDGHLKSGDELLNGQIASLLTALSDDWENWEIDPSHVKEERMIGQGQFGTVHFATWRGTPVVLKKLKADLDNPTSLAEFRSEMSMQHKLHHPNVVQFFGVVLSANPVCLCVEFMSGGSLEEQFNNPIAWSCHRATLCCVDILRALWYLHELKPNRVIHRDLKPANVLLSRSGVAKVADFGISKSVRLNKQNQLARSMSVKGEKFEMTGETGSYRYMAPEVYKHEPYGTGVDIYSFAMIAYQCFMWRRPFEDMTGVQACQAAVEGMRPLPDPKIVPKEAIEFLQQAWTDDADQRPTCDELVPKCQVLLDKLAPEGKNKGSFACCLM
mmetsp:Transcript_21511/g.25907  ORF Transcript_21511/g.25907 Transcript_21511/m.25907 type:complete len:488 (-) Transcript_21511:542-2005(-)|eukprot:CAMPEP_0197850008 /NCGR_PEP_ID=MMETSP1438-20131217/13951_1 /TAXON_ID=1461541 /ORGANISM="Pterosperma sp., Strain CCMP1384" /LENGTH=487 /DNA_ID=CAMNT_0043462951 /DNA_START=255 /DNA_END=1718 /DNA_ORIENTATION=+